MTTNILDETVSALDQGRLPDWIGDHVRRYRESDGREGHLWDATAVGGSGAVPCLLLDTLGRKSGRRYTHPLVYGVDADAYVIVASKGGSDLQPQWYHNLLATPAVEVQVAAERFTAQAVLATGSEHARLWRLMTMVYPPYMAYQAKTARVIPLFRLVRNAP